MNESVRYTHLTLGEVAERMTKRGVAVTRYFVVALFDAFKLTRRKAAKTGTYKQVEGRDEQFENIARLKAEYVQPGDLILSVDSKKKEQLGCFQRPGQLYGEQAQQVFTHDFASYADPEQKTKVAPFGIYDVVRNLGYVFLNQSADTADYAATCLFEYFKHYATKLPQKVKRVLLLCDSGGSNGARLHRFKELLQWISDRFGIYIRVAHYPSYCSKYNPCDHRLFPHVTRSMGGGVLDSMQTMRDLIKRRATTRKGLLVRVRCLKRDFQRGVKASKEFLENPTTIFEPLLPKWNYSFKPRIVNT